MTPSSPGLTRYYEYVLQNINEVDIVQKKQADGSYGSSYTVKKHNPDRGQKLIKKDASPEHVKKIENDVLQLSVKE